MHTKCYKQSFLQQLLDSDTHFLVYVGDCNIPANATLVYDINFVGIYSGNRKWRQTRFNCSKLHEKPV